MDKLTEEFKNSLINNAETGLEDYLELAVDNFIEDGILKDIPIVSSIVNGLKFAKNIYDRNLLKQTLVFISELNNGTLSKDKLIAYKSTIENNPKKCEEELGRILKLLNSEKSIILAKFFKSYINEEITWNEFCEYSEIINRIFVQDISMLIKIYNNEVAYNEGRERFRIERLVAVGLIYIGPEGEIHSGNYFDNDTLNMYSKKFVEIIKN